MEYRTGKCSACGAEYKIPASFAHDVARCKVCSGVVHISRPGGQSRPRASEPSRPAPPRAAARSVSAEAGARPQQRDAAQPTAPQHRQGAERREERPAPELVGASAGPAPAPGAEREQPVAARAAAPALGAMPVSAGQRSPAGRDARRERRPARGLLIAAGLLLLAAAAWFFRDQVLGASSAASDDVSAKEHATATTADPLARTLRSLPDFGPAPGTSEAEWAEMGTWLATWMNEPGEAGDLARTLLIAKGYEALPVIVNGMRQLDLASPAEEERGRRLHDALREICAGGSLEWSSGSTTADVVSNEKVILDWRTLWERASHDVDYLLRELALGPASPQANAIRSSYAEAPPGTGAPADENPDES